MANEQNLKPPFTPKEARELGRKGGIASAKRRRQLKTLADYLAIVEKRQNVPDKVKKNLIEAGYTPEEVDGLAVEARSLQARAERGDVNAILAKEKIMGRLIEKTEATIKAPKPLIDLSDLEKGKNE